MADNSLSLDSACSEAKRQKVECTRDAFDAFWSENNLQRVALLKAIEAATAEVFEKEVLAHKEGALQTQMRAVVLESNMAGIEEFGELWFVCIKAKMDRMTLCADWIGRLMLHCTDADWCAWLRRLGNAASAVRIRSI